MGVAVSKELDLSTNECLIKFAGKVHISPNDPFWNSFLTFNIIPPTKWSDQLSLENKIEPFLQILINNNLQSHNFCSLIDVFLIRASELITASTTDNNLFSWHIFNAIFSVRCILKYAIEILSEEQLIEHFECSNKLLNNSNRLESFLWALMGIIVDAPLKDITYAIHLEAVTCLLILLSIEIHSTTRTDQSQIFKIFMNGKQLSQAPIFMKNLLQNFMDQKKAPPSFGESNGSSIVVGFATELWSILTFNKKQNENEILNMDDISVPLATHSLLLVLVLANHCTIQPNPYRQTLFSCVNIQDNVTSTQSPIFFKIDYQQLFQVLCKRITGDTATLLLYLMLHRNTTFKTYLIARNDLDQLVIPILKTLYNAPDSNSHHIYMSLIILLILSEDDGFNRTIHETKLKNITWYSERMLSEVSLGGLLVLVVIRTIQYNMLKMKDKYLHTNCLAALANMSSQFRDLHPYVSQRLISLFETLAKRYQKFKVDIEPASVNGDVHVPVTQDLAEIEQYLCVLEEVLRMVLEIFNSALINQLHNNPNLVYTLLYKKDIFTPFKMNPVFLDIIHNIEIVISYFSELLTSKTQDHEVDAFLVLNVITDGAKHWPKDRLTKFPDLKFKYVEEEQPEEFFIPYIWDLVNQQSNIHWNAEDLVLLNATC